MNGDNFLELRNISKRFHGVQALKDVDFELRRGEIQCIVGENGSGKSTLIKIISGVYTPEPGGTITIDGVSQSDITPAKSTHLGIQVIYQDHSLFPNLTVAENIGIHQHLETGRQFVNWKKLRQTARDAMSKIDVSLDVERLVEKLSVADRQLVAICRAIAADARLVIMDEPTSSLTRQEVDALFKVVRDLQQKSITIVFVSHRLNEVMEIAERVTILRDGLKVATFDAKDMDDHKLGFLMTGQEISYSALTNGFNREKTILEVDRLSKKGNYRDISFDLHEGEVLGFTGLLGSGRTELALSLFGMNPPESGQIRINGETVHLATNHEAIARGIGYVPEDRLTLGLIMEQPVGGNIALTVLKTLLTRCNLIDSGKQKAFIDQRISDLNIRVPDAEVAVNTLSGGNQQRVVLAKWIATHPKILILDAPTVGVDVAAKSGIYEIVKRLASHGIGIILISDEVPELLSNCHRILLMRKGRLVGQYLPSEISEKELGQKINEG
ncbi:MAG: sugar ABC transporter ATP-binding protein [Desulfobacterales bacterium]|nr:MAG: sugar ABC transporter ATP-binding protein [Desulfobacterales bacterium]